jgi:hypothetical protein
MILGQRTRCIACATLFVASPDVGFPAREPVEDSTHYPLREEQPPPTPAEQTLGLSRHRLPLCPVCHRPVSWQSLDCAHCGHLFDPLDAVRRGQWGLRRDGEPHRGKLIDTLGTLSLLGGALTLCTGPIGVLAGMGFGIPALMMARNDLERMPSGAVDPEGRPLTEFGRNKSIVGIVLATLFALFWIVLALERYS